MEFCTFQVTIFFFSVGSCGNIQSALKSVDKMSDYQQSAASTSNARQVNNSSSGQGSEPSTYLPFQNLQIYSQMTILSREPGAPLPPIRNPGLLVKDVTAPLIEGVHYNPEQYVIVPGKDLFLQGKLLALYGKHILVEQV